jgi:hypothetical protein
MDAYYMHLPDETGYLKTAFFWRASVKAAVEKLAREDGVSMNQFVATAVAEKLASMRTAAFFAERCERADMAAFRQLLRCSGGQPPRDGDER